MRLCRHVVTLALILSTAITCFAGEITEGIVHVQYPDSQEALARQTAGWAADALNEFGQRLAPGDEPIRIVICSSHNEFATYAGPLAQVNVTGVAMPDKGVIAIKVPGIAPGGSTYRDTLRHELIHVLLARANVTDHMPWWLNEGLAMFLAGENEWNSRMRVAQMIVEGRVMELYELDLSVLAPGQEMEFGDAYAQALSMTRYLHDELGPDRFWAVIDGLREKSFGDSLREQTGKSPPDFYRDWVQSLWKFAVIFSIITGFSAFQLMAILTLIAYWRKRRRGKQLIEAWQEEEDEEDPQPYFDGYYDEEGDEDFDPRS